MEGFLFFALMIYLVGFFILCGIALFEDSTEMVLMAPVWPLFWVKYIIKALRE